MSDLDEMTWALCPVFLACEELDMPQIMRGPHPECRKCPGPDKHGMQSGCRIPAEIAARIALSRPRP